MRAVTLAGYAVVAAAAVSTEVVARVTGRIPTAAAVVAVALRHPAVRAIALAGWLWLGWHLFVRVDWLFIG